LASGDEIFYGCGPRAMGDDTSDIARLFAAYTLDSAFITPDVGVHISNGGAQAALDEFWWLVLGCAERFRTSPLRK